MKKFSNVDQDFYLWHLLFRTRAEIYKARQMELDKYNITFSQSGALFIIRAIGEKATPTEIARRLALKPHTVSGLLSRMEKDKLVRRVKDLDNKRQVRFVLTGKGREAYYRSSERESIHEIMSCLSDEEYQQLKSCLIKLKYRAQIVQDKVLEEHAIKYDATVP